MRKGSKRRKRTRSPIWTCVKAALIACALTVLLVLLQSLMLYWEWIGEDAVSVGNLIIKLASAALAGALCGRVCKERAWLMGGGAAALYYAVTVGILWLLLGRIGLTWNALADLCMVTIVGVCIAAVVALLKKRGDGKEKAR